MANKGKFRDNGDSQEWLSWDQFVKSFASPLPSRQSMTRVFRGHADSTWRIEPSLRRICQREGLDGQAILRVERQIFEEFKYSGYQYWKLDLTGGGDAWSQHLEALGWIQHHGGPTRCIDFSWSPFVAAYFAMEEPPSGENEKGKNGKCPVVIETPVPKNRLLGDGKLELSWKQWQGIFQPEYCKRMCPDYKPPISDYFYAVPRRLHERFARQQGVMLVAVDICKSLHEPLYKCTTIHRLNPKCRKQYLAGLEQMNITRKSLFEGPDAWARSLQSWAWKMTTDRG